MQPFQVDHTIEVIRFFSVDSILQLVEVMDQRSRSRSPPLVSHKHGDNKAWSNTSVRVYVTTPTYVSIVSHDLGSITYVSRALAVTPAAVPPVPPVRPAAVQPTAVPPASEAEADAGEAQAEAGADADADAGAVAEANATDAVALNDGVTN